MRIKAVRLSKICVWAQTYQSLSIVYTLINRYLFLGHIWTQSFFIYTITFLLVK